MRMFRNRISKVVTIVLMGIMFSGVSVLYAVDMKAPVTTQKSAQKMQPTTSTTSPAPVKYDPNAPPKGTITIPASSKGNVNASTWITGSYQYIQWTCNGTYSKLVDVTLWVNDKQVVVISKGIASGQTGYRVPTNMAEGTYELRITSQYDPRVEVRKTIHVILWEITITAPKSGEVLYLGDKYTITWTYKGTPPPMPFRLCPTVATIDGDCVPVVGHQFSSWTAGMGKGSVVLTLPTKPSGPLVGLVYLKGHTPVVYSMFRLQVRELNKVTSPHFRIACKPPYTYCLCNPTLASLCVQAKLQLFHCADLSTDVLNCGLCYHKCGPNMICDQGKCK